MLTAAVILIGESGVGKSKLFIRFLRDEYRPGSKVRPRSIAKMLTLQATIGVDFGSKVLTVGGQSITAQIWDTGAQPSPCSTRASLKLLQLVRSASVL